MRIFFHDSDVKYKRLKSYIDLDEIKRAAEDDEKQIFKISVKDDDAVADIEKYLEALPNCDIARYAPLTDEEYKERIEHDNTVLLTEEAVELVKRKIKEGDPFLFCRWGFIEASAVLSQIDCMELPIEYPHTLKDNAGVFPLNTTTVDRFIFEQIDAVGQADILVKWGNMVGQETLKKLYAPKAVWVRASVLEPFLFEFPWTMALEGKRVLVIHSYAELIQEQYKKREFLFKNPNVLPKFDLQTYEAVQSIGGNDNYSSWVEALEKMEEDIEKLEFDIALIGCGAYGMPLGGYIKEYLHRQAIHVGGALQLYFGIKGKRWETAYNYGERFYNEYWVRPGEKEKPKNWENVEGGCYW